MSDRFLRWAGDKQMSLERVMLTGGLKAVCALVWAGAKEDAAVICEGVYKEGDWIDGVTVARICSKAIRDSEKQSLPDPGSPFADDSILMRHDRGE